jgi:CysZ protein
MLAKTNNPIYATQCLFKGVRWLGKAPLRKFLVMPILINLVLYSIAFVLAYVYLLDFIAHWIPTWLHWLAWLLKPLFFICFMLVGFFTFTVLANLIASPFYGKLAEKTRELLVESRPPQEQPEETEIESEMTKPNALHSMLGELRRMAYFLKWAVLLVIISLIPGLNLISPFLWAIFGAWGCALEFFAYPLENKGLLFLEQKSVIANVRWGALSFGGIVLAGLGLPVFNLVVAPVAVIAATFYIYEIDLQQL